MNDYQRGTKDAWELARKICLEGDDCYSLVELEKIFGTHNLRKIMNVYTFKEAKQKVDEWNNREQYKVGDIIEFRGIKAFVTKVDDGVAHYLNANGESGGFIIDNHDADWKVTGHTNSIVYNGEMWNTGND